MMTLKINAVFYFLLLAIGLTLSSLALADEHIESWNKEQLKVIELNRWVALAPKEAGYEAYKALFHPEFTNWYMAGDKKALRTRSEYLALVKDWLDKGNYATYSKVTPISIDVFGEIAYIRQIKEEHFHHPDQAPTKFIGHFASVMKKHEGKWTFFRTSFETRYRGPMEKVQNEVVKK